MKEILKNRPRTETTWRDIKQLFHRHPVKTALVLPVATIALGLQMGLFYITIPVVLLNNVLTSL